MTSVTITISVQPTGEANVATGVAPVELSAMEAAPAPLALAELGVAADADAPSPEDFVGSEAAVETFPEPMPLEALEEAAGAPAPNGTKARRANRKES
jgi:hypothetical protein